MVTGDRFEGRAKIVVAGGGFAALEAVLALRALAGDRVHTTLVCPDHELRYRPAATVEAFGEGVSRTYDLCRIARDLRLTYRAARLDTVAPRMRSVRLSSGLRLEYDALILATGARAVASVPGALMFRDQRDVPLIREVLRELEAGTIQRLVFAVPSGSAWPLPLYELALRAASHARESGIRAAISLVSPERAPLSIFGAKASRLVAGVLADRGVSFRGGSTVTGVRRDGALALQADAAVESDRVITAPQLRATRITGIPARWWGFVPTDAIGRVQGLVDVYAAGDMTTFPIKHGGLAAQQADRIAHTIAASLGAPVKQLRTTDVLLARLIGGERSLLLRAELDWRGQPTTVTLDSQTTHAKDSTKVFARYLTPYLETFPPPTADHPTAP